MDKGLKLWSKKGFANLKKQIEKTDGEEIA